MEFSDHLQFNNRELSVADAIGQISSATGLDDQTIRAKIPYLDDPDLVKCCFLQYRGEILLFGSDRNNYQKFVVAIEVSENDVAFPSRTTEISIARQLRNTPGIGRSLLEGY